MSHISEDDRDQRVLRVLREADRLPGPDHLEFPEDFDHPRAKELLTELHARLEQAFSHPCTVDRHVQDASFHALVGVPAEATGAGVHIGIRLSNYADLAVVTLPDPGAHDSLDDAVARGDLTETDRRRVEDALSDLGFVTVPERLLHRPYDGVTPLSGFRNPDHPATWWTRFFDYI
ncbi:hypothetical protein [Streptomyces sp. NPDC047042]|uniref:hypothetical protein n=1 Tax=Streptomyces sp. NPDC047042 TaxID=3154807 RepID=UPI00340E85FE